MLFPIGFIVHVFCKNHKFLKTILYSFLISLFIENYQFILPISRTTELTDLLFNTLGGVLSAKFIKAKLNVQIIIDSSKAELINHLRENSFAVSVVNAKGYQESSKLLLFVEIDSARLEVLESLVNEYDDKAFIVVNETKFVQNGYFRGIAK